MDVNSKSTLSSSTFVSESMHELDDVFWEGSDSFGGWDGWDGWDAPRDVWGCFLA